MSFFQTIGTWIMGGLRRNKGIQTSAPGAYTEDAASPVSFDTALQVSAVWACVKLIAETVASLPINVYKLSENGRKYAANNDLNMLFSGKVNRYQTKVEFFETVLLNLLVHGNAYCKIARMNGRIVSLMPIMSSQVELRVLDDGAIVYAYYTDSGIEVLSEESVWHLKLMGNGVIGLSPLAYQRNTLGIAQAAESAVTNIYRNGAKPSGVLMIDKLLTPQQRDQVRANFYGLASGGQERLLVLEAGAKFEPVSLSPQDIQLLDSRKFQLAEICRWYGVPSVMVNDNNGSTVWGSGISQIVEGFYKLTLRPLLEKIETSILINLMPPGSGNKYEVEFSFDALLRTNMRDRFESYRIGVTGGFMTPNEARAYEHWELKEGADDLFMNSATLPIGQLEEQNGNQTPTADQP